MSALPKRIVLHSPALTNAGEYRDSGATLAVGDGTGQIAGDRAKVLLDGGYAVTEAAAERVEKAAE